MKGAFDECTRRDLSSRFRRNEQPHGKINTLLSDLLEKEEEIAVYKNRLKDLETAFCYNLEVISERDLEISVLEKQLHCEAEKQRAISRERDELEDLVKTIDEKKNRKIQQLETKLALKEDEIRELKKDHLSNINALKRIIDNLKTQRDEKMCKLNSRYELHKKELSKCFQEELEEKEKNYITEIDNLKGELEQARREKEKLSHIENEYRNLKFHLEGVERLSQEKENYYMEEIKKIRKPLRRHVTREVQCEPSNQTIDRNIQAEPNTTAIECQTKLSEAEDRYKKKISFLQEQNEVLKCVIKDMKKNKGDGKAEESGLGCECTAVGMVEKINKKFDCEINNIKKILEEERKQRREEENAIQSLETSIMCLKDKLIMELQEKLQRLSEVDGPECKQYSEIQSEIQISVLEEKLSKKIDTLVTSTKQEQQMINKKLEEIKKEWIDKMEKYLKPKQEARSDNLLAKIRLDIQKLENKIETDMKNIVKNNNLYKKYEKYRQPKEDTDRKEKPCLYTKPLTKEALDYRGIRGFYCKIDLESEKRMRTLKVENKGKIKSDCKKRNDLAVR